MGFVSCCDWIDREFDWVSESDCVGREFDWFDRLFSSLSHEFSFTLSTPSFIITTISSSFDTVPSLVEDDSKEAFNNAFASSNEAY